MPIDDTSSCEYHLKQIIEANAGAWPGQIQRLKEHNIKHAEAAMAGLKEFAAELGGMMKDLADRIADLEEEIYMLHIMDDRDD